MKAMISLLLLITMSLSCTAAFAGLQTGQVTSITKRTSDGLIYFGISGQATGRPSCAANTTYWMIKDENSVSGKQQLAMLMTARVTGKVITVYGSNTCLRWGDGEDVEIVIL